MVASDASGHAYDVRPVANGRPIRPIRTAAVNTSAELCGVRTHGTPGSQKFSCMSLNSFNIDRTEYHWYTHTKRTVHTHGQWGCVAVDPGVFVI